MPKPTQAAKAAPASKPVAAPSNAMAPQMPTGQAKPPKHHSHLGMWILGFVLIVLVLALVYVALTLVDGQSDAEMHSGDLEGQVNNLMMELDEKEAELVTAQEELGMLMDDQENAEEFPSIHFGTNVDGNVHGVAVVEGYYEQQSMPLGLGEDAETDACSVFVVTAGPDWVLDAYSNPDLLHFNRDFVLGGTSYSEFFEGMQWEGSPHVTDSSVDNPIKAIFRIGRIGGGELVGCDDTVALVGTVPSE